VEVGGPFGGPRITVGELMREGVEGTFQLISVLKVVDVPEAKSVGLLQVSV
jgi:hypothetical protein